ncbi:MAG: GNAT family N-acetyltransferase [Actinomycetota bacterium]|nr:GNAT family N-acetyltransferase [Actinomycetota bacterium]
MAVTISPVAPEHLPQMAAMVARRVAALRVAVPTVPPAFADPAVAQAALARMCTAHRGLVALTTDGTVAGHLCWHDLDGFRRTTRRTAWIPEYGCVVEPAAAQPGAHVRDLLYRAAAQQWDASSRQLLAVTQLVGEPDADEHWIENGFGRFLADGVRPCRPIGATLPLGVTVRPATHSDLARLVQLDDEHCSHYGRPPVFMVPPQPATAAELSALLAGDTVLWVAADGDGPQAFLRAELGADSSCELLQGADTLAVTGIYTRPAARGRGVGAALFDAALRHHAARGVPRTGFDYETINPTARAFWPRLVTTVARSYMRALERT